MTIVVNPVVEGQSTWVVSARTIIGELIEERSTWAMSTTTIIGALHAKPNIEATLKFEAPGVLKIRAKLKLEVAMELQSDEWRKRQGMAVLDRPRRHKDTRS